MKKPKTTKDKQTNTVYYILLCYAMDLSRSCCLKLPLLPKTGHAWACHLFQFCLSPNNVHPSCPAAPVCKMKPLGRNEMEDSIMTPWAGWQSWKCVSSGDSVASGSTTWQVKIIYSLIVCKTCCRRPEWNSRIIGNATPPSSFAHLLYNVFFGLMIMASRLFQTQGRVIQLTGQQASEKKEREI